MMDVGPKDPTKIEARSPQSGRSGFLNSAPASPAAAGASESRQAAAPSPATAPGLFSPVGAKALEKLFSGIGLKLGPEPMARVGERVAQALALVAARQSTPVLSGGVSGAALPQDIRQRAVSAYKRAGAPASHEADRPVKARFLALLEGLFAAQGLDLDPEGLLALDADLDRGAGGSGNGENQGKKGTESATAGNEMAAEGESRSELEAFEAMVKDFFRSDPGNSGPWLDLKRAGVRTDPSWQAFPFAFSANNVEFAGIFRVLSTREPPAVLSLGADFRSNGHDYSFTLSASSLALEGPAEAVPGRDGVLRSLSDSLESLGIGFAFRPIQGLESAEGRGEAWA